MSVSTKPEPARQKGISADLSSPLLRIWHISTRKRVSFPPHLVQTCTVDFSRMVICRDATQSALVPRAPRMGHPLVCMGRARRYAPCTRNRSLSLNLVPPCPRINSAYPAHRIFGQTSKIHPSSSLISLRLIPHISQSVHTTVGRIHSHGVVIPCTVLMAAHQDNISEAQSKSYPPIRPPIQT